MLHAMPVTYGACACVKPPDGHSGSRLWQPFLHATAWSSAFLGRKPSAGALAIIHSSSKTATALCLRETSLHTAEIFLSASCSHPTPWPLASTGITWNNLAAILEVPAAGAMPTSGRETWLKLLGVLDLKISQRSDAVRAPC